MCRGVRVSAEERETAGGGGGGGGGEGGGERGGYLHQGRKRISMLIQAMGQRSVWSHPHTELQLGVTHVQHVHQLNKPEGSFPGEDRGENQQVVTSQ